jgi:4-hydroxybenzoate polyprenyltransferase
MNTFTEELKNSILKEIFRKLRIYYVALRVKEILLIGGVTFLGLVFNTTSYDQSMFSRWLVIMLASYSLLGHAFASNDWSGYKYDKNDVNKSNRPLMKGELSLTEIKVMCISLLIFSLTMAAIVSYISLLMVIGVVILNYLYSGEKVFLKSMPVISTIIHGLGATLGFLLGYGSLGYLDFTGISFAFYFGILYAAGHLNHEISDLDSDRLSGIPTNADLLGKKKAFIFSFILFSFSFVYVILLSFQGVLPQTIIIGVVIAYPVYSYFFWTTLYSSLSYESMISFRRKYRFIFLFWGIFMALNIILDK